MRRIPTAELLARIRDRHQGWIDARLKDWDIDTAEWDYHVEARYALEMARGRRERAA